MGGGGVDDFVATIRGTTNLLLRHYMKKIKLTKSIKDKTLLSGKRGGGGGELSPRAPRPDPPMVVHLC